MKLRVLSAAIASALLMTACQQEATETATETTAAAATPAAIEFNSEREKQAYSLGVFAGRFISTNIDTYADAELQLDQALVSKGFTDAMADNPQLSDEDVQELLTALDAERVKFMEAKAAADAAEASEAGKTFLTENAAKEGIQVTDTGLQLEVIEAGEGEAPAATDTVTVHYRGTLVDGTQFDSSYDRGEPATFPLNRVIPGWTEGLQLMNIGGKYRLYIPSELGYGERGAGADIPPNATLIFDIELLDIVKPEAAAE